MFKSRRDLDRRNVRTSLIRVLSLISGLGAGSPCAFGQDPSGVLRWFGYFGGPGYDEFRALDVGPDGAIWAAGTSNRSMDLPEAAAGFEVGDNRRDFDVVVAKISPDGRELIWKGIIGGPGRDMAMGIDVGDDGIVTVTGMAGTRFPVTENAFQSENRGDFDVFVVRLDPTREDPEEGLLYSTLLGGGREDVRR